MEYVKIEKVRLKELLAAEMRLDCLEYDGVDNWEWYMESKHEFVEDAAKELGIEYNNDMDFEDIAEELVKYYDEV